jgi:iron complex transport system substrate-binding protein
MKKNIFNNIKIAIVCLFFILILSIISILPANASENAFIQDSLNRKVAILPYNRIGIINPAAIKTFRFLEVKPENIVGVDSFSIKFYKDYLTTSTVNLGDFNNPNLEIILSLKIDLLILDQSFPINKLKDLEKFNINYFVYSTSAENYDTLISSLHNLSILVSKEEKYNLLYKDFIQIYEKKIRETSTIFKDKTALSIVWADKSIMVAGCDSYLAYMLALAGIKYSILEKGWVQISIETLLKLNPDFIIVATADLDKNYFTNPIFKSLKAYKNKKIYFFSKEDENILLQPSFDLWKGIYELLLKFVD